MEQYINKSALVAEIEKRLKKGEEVVKEVPSSAIFGLIQAYKNILSFIDTLEVKGVDLTKEVANWKIDHQVYGMDEAFYDIAKHFFELGLSASNPITAEDRGTAEEIIINLKRVENDYRIDLTKEIGWLRNKAHKGE